MCTKIVWSSKMLPKKNGKADLCFYTRKSEMPRKYLIKTKKWKSVSLDMKMEILNQLEKWEKPSSIAESYEKSAVRTIKKNGGKY